MQLLAVSSALVMVSVSACASTASSPSPPAQGSTRGSTQPEVSGKATSKAANKAAAKAEAARLVSRAVLVPGATRLSGRPESPSGPAMGESSSSQEIDTVAYFRVARSLEQTREWFEAHPQPGLDDGGSSNAGGPSGPTSYGFEYDPRSQPWTWGTASLQLSLAPEGGSATLIRVDGVADWIDPNPARDTTTGPTARVTVAGGCPAGDDGIRDIRNPGAPDLDHQLVPTARPTAAIECTYDGLNGSPFRLTAHRALTAAQARAEARRLLGLPLGQRGAGVVNCPSDDGRATVLAFSYAGRADVDIWEYTSGCEYTDNGHIVSREI